MSNLGDSNTPLEGESFGLPSGWSITENADGEVVIEDSGANVVLRRDETAGEWVTDSIDASSINTEQATIGNIDQLVEIETVTWDRDPSETNTVDLSGYSKPIVLEFDCGLIDASGIQIQFDGQTGSDYEHRLIGSSISEDASRSNIQLVERTAASNVGFVGEFVVRSISDPAGADGIGIFGQGAVESGLSDTSILRDGSLDASSDLSQLTLINDRDGDGIGGTTVVKGVPV